MAANNDSGPGSGPNPGTGSIYGLAGKTPAQRARILKAEALAESVFGNRRQAGAWMYTYTPRVANARVLPMKAVESLEGYKEVIAELERLRPRAAPPQRKSAAPALRMRRRR